MPYIFKQLILIFLILFLHSSCSNTVIHGQNTGVSRFLALEKKFDDMTNQEMDISSFQFNNDSKIVIWMHGTKRPSLANNFRCTNDLPPESLMLAAKKLDMSVYYLCSNATDGESKGSFIYKRVDELREKIKQLNEAGLRAENIFVSGFSAGGWTALMAARMLPNEFNRGVLFAPAFAGPRYEIRLFPIWRKVLRPKQISEILEAKRLDFLIFAYDDDPFNRPEDLIVFQKSEKIFPKIIGYTCNEGHFTYKNDCKSQETYEKILTFFQSSDS